MDGIEEPDGDVDGKLDGRMDGIDELDGAVDGKLDGRMDGIEEPDGAVDGKLDGDLEVEGFPDGNFEGKLVGVPVGVPIGAEVEGFPDGTFEGKPVGVPVGANVCLPFQLPFHPSPVHALWLTASFHPQPFHTQSVGPLLLHELLPHVLLVGRFVGVLVGLFVGLPPPPQPQLRSFSEAEDAWKWVASQQQSAARVGVRAASLASLAHQKNSIDCTTGVYDVAATASLYDASSITMKSDTTIAPRPNLFYIEIQAMWNRSVPPLLSKGGVALHPMSTKFASINGARLNALLLKVVAQYALLSDEGDSYNSGNDAIDNEAVDDAVVSLYYMSQVRFHESVCMSSQSKSGSNINSSVKNCDGNDIIVKVMTLYVGKIVASSSNNIGRHAAI
eukprot:scaffold1926_cov83-Skeletonema_dohrnii-CCMP3373.AAC.1